MRKTKYYALYKGDKFIDIGTIQYLSNLLNVTPKTIIFYASPAHLRKLNSKKNKKKYTEGTIVVKIDDD